MSCQSMRFVVLVVVLAAFGVAAEGDGGDGGHHISRPKLKSLLLKRLPDERLAREIAVGLDFITDEQLKDFAAKHHSVNGHSQGGKGDEANVGMTWWKKFKDILTDDEKFKDILTDDEMKKVQADVGRAESAVAEGGQKEATPSNEVQSKEHVVWDKLSESLRKWKRENEKEEMSGEGKGEEKLTSLSASAEVLPQREGEREEGEEAGQTGPSLKQQAIAKQIAALLKNAYPRREEEDSRHDQWGGKSGSLLRGPEEGIADGGKEDAWTRSGKAVGRMNGEGELNEIGKSTNDETEPLSERMERIKKAISLSKNALAKRQGEEEKWEWGNGKMLNLLGNKMKAKGETSDDGEEGEKWEWGKGKTLNLLGNKMKAKGEKDETSDDGEQEERRTVLAVKPLTTPRSVVNSKTAEAFDQWKAANEMRLHVRLPAGVEVEDWLAWGLLEGVEHEMYQGPQEKKTTYHIGVKHHKEIDPEILYFATTPEFLNASHKAIANGFVQKGNLGQVCWDKPPTPTNLSPSNHCIPLHDLMAMALKFESQGIVFPKPVPKAERAVGRAQPPAPSPLETSVSQPPPAPATSRWLQWRHVPKAGEAAPHNAVPNSNARTIPIGPQVWDTKFWGGNPAFHPHLRPAAASDGDLIA